MSQEEKCSFISVASTETETASEQSCVTENGQPDGDWQPCQVVDNFSVAPKCAIEEPHPSIPKSSVLGGILWAKYYAALNGTLVVPPQPKPIRRNILEPIRFSLAYARGHGVTDAILLYHLQVSTCDPRIYKVVKMGKEWLAGYSLNDCLRDLPCFNSRQTIYDGLRRLAERDDIDSDCTGELWGFPGGNCLSHGAPRWNKATDARGWYAVKNPKTLPMDIVTIETADAKAHGMLKACILSKFYGSVGDEDGWQRLSATELAKEFPYSRVKIQNALSEMIESGLVIRHATKPKLHQRGEGKPKPVADKSLKVESYSFFDLDGIL